MAQHGYLHDTYDSDDFGRGDDRERGWRDRDQERGWGGREGDWRERDRGSMFGWRDRDRDDDDRGFFDRAGDEMRSWFRDEDEGREFQRSRGESRSGPDRGMSHYGREHGFGGFQGDYGRSGRQQGGFGGRGDYSEGRQSFSAHPDDHYRSWRQKQIEALDRDYQEYCRECEQRFHQDFDSWRQNRQGQGGMSSQGQSATGQSQSQQGGSSDEVMDLDNPAAMRGGEIPGATTSPMGAGTLGTNNSENTAGAPTATGRGRR